MEERRLAAIMFTDIVGYTALMGESEAKALQLLEKNRDIQKPLIKMYHGQFLKEMGDGMLASFTSVSDAVHCAQQILKISKEEPDLKLHIGIHLGEVIFSDGDVFGDGVNIASRIESSAKEGEIYISEDVWKNIRNKEDVPVEFVGKKTFKNVKDPVGLYRLKEAAVQQSDTSPKRSGWKMPGKKRVGLIATFIATFFIVFFIASEYFLKGGKQPLSTVDKSIAVLPFKSINNDKQGDFFSDGVMETIISHLSKIKAIKVISRTSVEQYRATVKTASQIASELDVVYLLVGSAQKFENELRISVQLINGIEDYNIWSENYDKDLTDLFKTQSEIANEVANAIGIHITDEEQQRIVNIPTSNLEAYDMYVNGRYYWNKRTEKDLLVSLDYFEKAIQLDAEFAQAWAGLSDAYCMLTAYDYMPSNEGHSKAKSAANRAIKLNNQLAEAHTSLGWIYAFYDHNWEGSKKSFELALKNEPNYSTAHSWLAWVLAAQGNLEVAEQHIQMARRLDPLSNIIMASTGWISYTRNSFERARSLFKSAIELNPDFPRFHLWAGHNYMVVKKYDSAIIHLEKAVHLSNRHPQYLANLGLCYGSAGKTEKAEQVLDELLAASQKRFITNYDLGLIYLGVEQDSLAIEYFKNAFDDGDIWVSFLAVDPRFNYLHTNPNFVDIIKQAGIIPPWQP